MSEFAKRCTKVAESFLQTVVVVDDQACLDDSYREPQRLKTPSRRGAHKSTEEKRQVDADKLHSLDARQLVATFAQHGLVCAPIAPQTGSVELGVVSPAARRADIVILDWQLDQDNGKGALRVIKEILKEDADGRLRLIAVYTGEPALSEIGGTLAEELRKEGRPFQTDGHRVVLTRGHCRIVIYAKSQTRLVDDLKDRAISEEEVAKRLIADFAEMTTGILPCVALTSLAAVRENAHRVLERFSARLDPAFLAHRACLPSPSDSQDHMVAQIASELHAIMEDAAAECSPADAEAVEQWLESSVGPCGTFKFEKNKELPLTEAKSVLANGLRALPNGFGKDKASQILTSGFANKPNSACSLDSEFAWMVNFRTVCNIHRPTLRLGTALKLAGDGEGGPSYFLCMRPWCDSARLKGKEPFLLLRLAPPESNTVQLVLRIGEQTFHRVSVSMKASEWTLAHFEPAQQDGPVLGSREGSGTFFVAEDGSRFEWLGELKPEFAQRVAHHFASRLSRVPVDNSEWLRRLENLDQ